LAIQQSRGYNRLQQHVLHHRHRPYHLQAHSRPNMKLGASDGLGDRITTHDMPLMSTHPRPMKNSSLSHRNHSLLNSRRYSFLNNRYRLLLSSRNRSLHRCKCRASLTRCRPPHLRLYRCHRHLLLTCLYVRLCSSDLLRGRKLGLNHPRGLIYGLL